MSRTIELLNQKLIFPSEQMQHYRDCNAFLGSPALMRDRLQEDGYLLIRGLINKEKVLTARRTILEYAKENSAGLVFRQGTDIMDAVAGEGSPGRTLGIKDYTHQPKVLAVLENESLFTLFRNIFGIESRTFDYKWLRFIAPRRSAAFHKDWGYMDGGSKRVLTCWIPLDNIPVEKSTLTHLVGSHKLKIDSHNDMNIINKCQNKWLTADFEMGDVLIFGMHFFHTSTTNLTKCWRISCDVRFQPAIDPIDKRWVD